MCCRQKYLLQDKRFRTTKTIYNFYWTTRKTKQSWCLLKSWDHDKTPKNIDRYIYILGFEGISQIVLEKLNFL